MSENWKKRLGVVYSTDPDYEFNSNKEIEEETLEPHQQDLRIKLDKVAVLH